MKPINLTAPISDEAIKSLRVGDEVLLSGEIYTGRDAAHKRMCEMLDNDLPLPFDIDGQVIYYAGPCPAPKGRVTGSIGPTTSSRMDSYAPCMIERGLKVMIGKGERDKSVIDAIREHMGLYLAAVGGAGALLSLCVKSSELIAFEELGAEAIYRLYVQDMPLTVAVDCNGGNIYDRS